MGQQDRSEYRTWHDRQVPHGQAVLETVPPAPLPPPSAAAARFLTPDPTPAELDPDGWFEPSEALARSAALFQAQHQVVELSTERDAAAITEALATPAADAGADWAQRRRYEAEQTQVRG